MSERSSKRDSMIRLVSLDDLPTGDDLDGIEVESDAPHRPGAFVLRCGDEVRAYVNRCPHRGTPFNWTPDRFVDLERKHIICATHGALFRIDDGHCVAGPCAGDALVPVPLEVRDGVIFVSDWRCSD